MQKEKHHRIADSGDAVVLLFQDDLVAYDFDDRSSYTRMTGLVMSHIAVSGCQTG